MWFRLGMSLFLIAVVIIACVFDDLVFCYWLWC